ASTWQAITRKALPRRSRKRCLSISRPPVAAADVTFAVAGKTVASDGTETILAVAKRAGLNIPSSCNFGLCGTCKVQKVSGEVSMIHNGGSSDDEISDGMILACCARPIGPVAMNV